MVPMRTTIVFKSANPQIGKRAIPLLPVCLFAICLFIISCGNETEEKLSNVKVTVVPSTDNEILPGMVCSDHMNKLVAEASKEGLVGIVVSGEEAEKHLSCFNVRDALSLSAECRELLKKAAICRLAFRKNNQPCAEVYEWSFASAADVTKVIDALSQPLTQEQKKVGYERFLPNPFTFWQYENRIYFLSAPDEKQRADMDKLNNVLNSVLGTTDKLY